MTVGAFNLNRAILLPIKSDRHTGESRNPGNAEHPLDTGFRRYDAVLWGESLKLGLNTLNVRPRFSNFVFLSFRDGFPGLAYLEHRFPVRGERSHAGGRS
ncbi:MAG: hypothetical protein WAW37_17490 [Syntrophobacteraceae bacterium]